MRGRGIRYTHPAGDIYNTNPNSNIAIVDINKCACNDCVISTPIKTRLSNTLDLRMVNHPHLGYNILLEKDQCLLNYVGILYTV